MRTSGFAPSGPNVGRLEHQHQTEIEAVSIQLHAIGRAIEELAAAVEEVARDLPGGVPPQVADRLDAARWQLGKVW